MKVNLYCDWMYRYIVHQSDKNYDKIQEDASLLPFASTKYKYF